MEREEIDQALESCHGDGDEACFGNNRIIAGYYYKTDIQIAFYYKPSFYSRMKMYWIFGWSWKDIKGQNV